MSDGDNAAVEDFRRSLLLPRRLDGDDPDADPLELFRKRFSPPLMR